MNHLFLPIFERLLNQYLKLDTEMQQQLEAFSGSVIRIRITSLDWQFFIIVKNKHLELKNHYEGPIDASLTSGITQLLKSAGSESKISQDMELTGNIGLIQALTKIFKSVEIDFEEIMSKYLGDTVAHGLANALKEFKAFNVKLVKTKQENLTEYLQEEINLLIHPLRMSAFTDKIESLRDDVARLEAKVQLLGNRFEKN